jgi:hypothetical protein
MKAIMPSAAFLANGGSSGETFRVVPSKIPRKPRDVPRRMNKAARMATTAAAMTEAEAEGFAKLAIGSVYIISGRAAEGQGGVNARRS